MRALRVSSATERFAPRWINELSAALYADRQAACVACSARGGGVGIGAGAGSVTDALTSCPGGGVVCAGGDGVASARVCDWRSVGSVGSRGGGGGGGGTVSADRKISGCPQLVRAASHCRHWLARCCATRRRQEQRLSTNCISVAASTVEMGAAFGRQIVKVPARRVAEAVERLLVLYKRERERGGGAARVLSAGSPKSESTRRSTISLF